MTLEYAPDLDDCVTIYLNIWDKFGTDTFSVSDAVVELHQQDAADDLLDGGGPQQQLDLLVAYGLLERVSDDEYRIRCQPGETKLEWWEQLEAQIETLHDAIHEARQTASGESERSLLTYRGHTYVSCFVDDQATLSDVVDDLRDIEDLHDGIAFRSPATMASEVQDIADQLCNTTWEDVPAFEKVNSEVKGEDNDDLEFRLYVTPRDN